MKFDFAKPKKSKILIYDKESTKFADILFPKKNYEIIYTRRERINIYIFIITIFKTGFKNLKNNYKKNFINCVSPKIVLCGIDNHAGFYNLKQMCSNPVYISIQPGLCSKERYKNFYEYCRKYYRENKKKLAIDHSFVFSKTEKSMLSKIINTKIHVVGSILNNEFPLNFKKKKYKSILYISANDIVDFKLDKKIFGHLIEFGKSKKIKLYYLGRGYRNVSSLLVNAFPKGNWKYIFHKSYKKRYQIVNKQQLIVFTHSTFGFEAMAKGIKCLKISKKPPTRNIGKIFPIEGFYKKYDASGEFWTNSLKSSDFKIFLNKMINRPNSKWKKIAKSYSKEILSYDPYNYKIKKIIKNILNKKN